VLDSGLAGNDEYFWQEVHERYQQSNQDHDYLAFELVSCLMASILQKYYLVFGQRL
jgi:hypothetical protein